MVSALKDSHKCRGLSFVIRKSRSIVPSIKFTLHDEVLTLYIACYIKYIGCYIDRGEIVSKREKLQFYL